ncbi:MAG: M23 family metallopeptidase [Microbacterium sp.]|nr:M23 family metallopeptidase [Microbacterium sp.]
MQPDRAKCRDFRADTPPHSLPQEGQLPGAPIPFERRTVGRRAAIGAAALGAAAILTAHALPAVAESYPSWEEVQAARSNQARKASQIVRIQQLIRGLTDQVARTRAAAATAADDLYTAQQDYFEISRRAAALGSQAKRQATTADEAAARAGRLAAQLYRKGGNTALLELLLSTNGAQADELLARLSTSERLLEANRLIYSDAVIARDSAQSLANQAEVARTERERLQRVADQKLIASQKAADAASAALTAQSLRLVELQAQLNALQDVTTRTVAAYRAGVEAERRKAAARAEAARRAAAAAGANPASGAGWARPTRGGRTSSFGPRSSQCGNGYCSTSYHYGVDLSSGCGSPIYAAASGTVVYAGGNGGYGNYIRLDHGGGVGTGYAHISNGGFLVRHGQRVTAGALIAREGNTGNAFGCNLHFETYVNGTPVNPIGFMAARGITL